MKNRILFGTIMIVAFVALLWLDWHLQQADTPTLTRTYAIEVPTADGPLVRRISQPVTLLALPLGAVCLPLLALGYFEVAKFSKHVGVKLLPFSGLLGAAALGTSPVWIQFLPLGGSQVGLGMLWVPMILLPLIFLEQMSLRTTQDAIRRVGGTLLAVGYLGLGTAAILGLRMVYGVEMLVLVIAAVKFTDIGAYFAGTRFGKHKMIPWLSPGKSWEGLAGGLAAAAIVATLAAWLMDVQELTLLQAAVLGVLLGVAGQFGDLCESLLKRDANVKDSGALVPNFGGVLDIMDSPLIAAPIALVLLAVLT
jgi:phosphatidate cytidylyltransferase